MAMEASTLVVKLVEQIEAGVKSLTAWLDRTLEDRKMASKMKRAVKRSAAATRKGTSADAMSKPPKVTPPAGKGAPRQGKKG
jgi:hypothetical protein